jgi:hypothetical protein
MAVQEPDDEEVYKEATQADGEDRAGFDGWRFAKVADGFKDDVTRDEAEQDNMNRHDEDFEAREAICMTAARRTAGEGGRAEGEDEACRIGEHVTGIGNEREGVREEAGYGLDNDECGRQKEAGNERFTNLIRVRVHCSMLADGLSATVQAGATLSWPMRGIGPAG